MPNNFWSFLDSGENTVLLYKFYLCPLTLSLAKQPALNGCLQQKALASVQIKISRHSHQGPLRLSLYRGFSNLHPCLLESLDRLQKIAQGLLMQETTLLACTMYQQRSSCRCILSTPGKRGSVPQTLTCAPLYPAAH